MQVHFRCPPELESLLPRPQPASGALPDWLKTMPAAVDAAALDGPVRTAKQCPPLLDAMGCGFLMPLAADVKVSAGRFDWSWAPPPGTLDRTTRSPLAFHLAEQVHGSPLGNPGEIIIKFNNFWTIELEPGYSLLCTHPFNREDLPFRTLTGLVDADRYHDNFIQFPARWLDPAFDGVLPRGTPVVQCVPIQRASLELVCDRLDGDAAAQFVAARQELQTAPGIYRRLYRATRS